MALSKATLIPYWPKDLHTILVEKESAAGANFTPGTLVVEVSGSVVACDTDTVSHRTLPAYMVWTDGSTRVDTTEYKLDGTTVQLHTCLAGQFKADVKATLFTATPVAGDVIAKSATAGQLDPLDAAQLAALIGSGAERVVEVIGRVEGASRKAGLDSTFFNCSFDLG